MSIQYIPKRKIGVAKTVWSYNDGSFDSNVDSAQWLGAVHKLLGLPLGEDSDPVRVPWSATARETRAWSEKLKSALETLRIEDGYLVAWCELLRTCGGYTTI